MNQFGCPYSKDPSSKRAGQGGPRDGTAFANLATGATERRRNGGNIKDENVDRTSNEAGTLSMANTGEKDTGGSQFFINVCGGLVSRARLEWGVGGHISARRGSLGVGHISARRGGWGSGTSAHAVAGGSGTSAHAAVSRGVR